MVLMCLHCLGRLSIFGSVVLGLVGCVIETKVPLHDVARRIPLDRIAPLQNMSFLAPNGDHLFLRRVQGQMTVMHASGSGVGGPAQPFDVALYEMDGLPKSVFVAMRQQDGVFEYVPFFFDPSGILVLSPRKRQTVKTLDAFHKAVQEAPGRPVFYKRLSAKAGDAAYREYSSKVAARRRSKEKRAYEYVRPFRVFDPGIRRFAVGDQVYWLRRLQTERMEILDINISTGYLMLRRNHDGAHAKVHHSHVMTQKQAGANGIKHGMATAQSAFCIARVTECEW